MTPQQARLVQDSFLKLLDMPDSVGVRFYSHLFELEPRLRRLFRGEIAAQGRMFMRMIGIGIQSLGNVEELESVFRDLGRRHQRYGVKDADYDTVGVALLWTLEVSLGEDFNDEVRDAWRAVYRLLADNMRRAAAESGTTRVGMRPWTLDSAVSSTTSRLK